MRKSYIQFLIVIICLVSVYIVYNSFFISKSFVEEEIKDSISNGKEMTNLDPKSNSIKKNEVNLISNLKYKSFDTMGNEYLINSKSAEVSSNNEELIKLIDVSAKIILKNKSPIYINSDYAIHNKNEFDTKFYENVYIVHDDLKIFSENLDLMYNSNFVSLYNIKEIYNKNIKLKADKIDFDMLTKDVSINMYKNDQKVKIIYK